MFVVVYKDSHCSSLQHKEFKTMKEVKAFLKDPDDEICMEGDTVSYYIVGGEITSADRGTIDKT